MPDKQLIERAKAAQKRVYALAGQVKDSLHHDDDRLLIPVGDLSALGAFLETLETILDQASDERQKVERGG